MENQNLNKRLDYRKFSDIIDEIEFQKTFLFYILLPEVDLIDPFGKQNNIKLKPSNKMEYCVSSVGLPSLNIQTMTVPYFNSELKFASKVTYNNWSATFRLDVNNQTGQYKTLLPKKIPIPKINSIMDILNTSASLNSLHNSIKEENIKELNNSSFKSLNTYMYFYQWISSVYDSQKRTSYLPLIYKRDIDVFLLNEMGEPTMQFTLKYAFPASINPSNLDYSTDGLFTFTVDFAFDRYIATNEIK